MKKAEKLLILKDAKKRIRTGTSLGLCDAVNMAMVKVLGYESKLLERDFRLLKISVPPHAVWYRFWFHSGERTKRIKILNKAIAKLKAL